MPQTLNSRPTHTSRFSTVHASAGSGKTYYLVSHIIRTLILGASPGSILAITFTRMAAAEMQQRLLMRVFWLATCSESDLKTALKHQFDLDASDTHCQRARELYEELLHSPQNVRATTFHAFCQDLLRRFPMESNLPPGFELLERTGHLIDEAWNTLSNKLTEATLQQTPFTCQADMDVLLEHFGTDRTKAILNKFIAARSEWWALSQKADFSIDRYLQTLAEQLETIPTDSAEELIQSYMHDADTLQQLGRFIELLSLHPIQTHQQFIDALNKALAADASDRGINGPFRFVWNTFFTQKNEIRARKSSKTLLGKLGEQGCAEFIAIHEDQSRQLIELRQRIHAHETLRLTRAWLGAGAAFLEEYQTIKQLHRYLDFSDLEWQCYCLLNTSDHADWVQYKLDQRIDHLLVDEFQDTNPTQWQLLLPLLSELAAAESERMRSVLFVGDAKQSIYRFRRAEPRLFATATEWLEERLQATKHFLNHSYRSSPAIIKFVNKLFNDNAMLPLPDFQTHETYQSDLSGCVTILPLFGDETKTVKPDKTDAIKLRNPLHSQRPDSFSPHREEARAIAHHIRSMIEDKTVIGQGDDCRYLQAADILILLRNRIHAKEYEQALREAHIPYLGTERGTLLESLEIKDMVNLLQWLITPFDNHALAGILRSPLFSASNEDLFFLAGKPNWFETLLEHADAYPHDHPIRRAAKLLDQWTGLTDELPVHDLLDHIYSEANVFASYQACYPKHLQARVQSNLTRFIELALENDSGRYPSLTRFLSWLRLLRQQDKEAPDQPASDAVQSRVRILTVHESKGLEAPVVFLADSATSQSHSGGDNDIIDWPSDAARPDTFLLSPSAPFPNEFCARALARKEEKDAQENANLLYVAVTRAKQYLYISASNKSTGWYQALCDRFDLDAQKLTDITPIETYKGVASQVKLPQNDIATKGLHAVDSRLTEPLTLESNLIEIAPSQHENENELHSVTQSSKAPQDLVSRLKPEVRGEIIHDMLLFLAASDMQDNNVKLLQYCRPRRLDDSDNEIQQCWSEARQTLSEFPAYFSGQDYDSALNEVPVYYTTDRGIVHGIIDRLIISPTEAIIIDYKTHDIDPQQTKTHLEELAERYRPQLDLYKQGIQRIYPKHTIRTLLIFTSLPTAIEIKQS